MDVETLEVCRRVLFGGCFPLCPANHKVHPRLWRLYRWPRYPKIADGSQGRCYPAYTSQLLAAITVLFHLTACSQSVPEPLLDAQRFLENAAAYQEKATSISNITNGNFQSTHEVDTERQLVRGGALHVREIWDGNLAVDLTTDGKCEFSRDAQGAFEEDHGDAAAAYKEQKWLSIRAIVPHPRDGNPALVGHENVNGTAASVFIWSAPSNTMRETVQVWIADADHRPLRVQTTLQGVAPGLTKGPVVQTDTTNFSYDPSVQVVLPKL